jgi:hypothetical protein
MRLFAVCAVLGALAVPSASAVEATIAPGVGIGKVKLGMTLKQVKRALGQPQLVNEREGAYTEYAWDFGTWTVGLQNGRVVQISTTSRAQKTTTGVGMRTKIERVLGAFPGGVCTSSRGFGSATPPDPRFLQGYATEYLTTRKGGAQTIFVLHKPSEATNLNPFDQGRGWVVTEVYIRQPFRPLPEFGASWPYRGKVADCR